MEERIKEYLQQHPIKIEKTAEIYEEDYDVNYDEPVALGISNDAIKTIKEIVNAQKFGQNTDIFEFLEDMMKRLLDNFDNSAKFLGCRLTRPFISSNYIRSLYN